MATGQLGGNIGPFRDPNSGQSVQGRVAGTFDCQLVDAVPAGPNDQPVHFILTESRFLEIPL